MASDKHGIDINKQFGGLAELVELADMIDAARYRWLRNRARQLQDDRVVPYIVYGGSSLHGEQLDMAIDALIMGELVTQ